MSGGAVPLQHRGWLPDRDCFGCGPDNPHGLHIESTLDDDGVAHATWTAEEHHRGPPGVVNGAVVAIPMDCHGAWTAIASFRDRARSEGRDPDGVAAVTASYSVTLRSPTPTAVPLTLRAVVRGTDDRRADVLVETRHDGLVTATFEGIFVEVAWPS